MPERHSSTPGPFTPDSDANHQAILRDVEATVSAAATPSTFIDDFVEILAHNHPDMHPDDRRSVFLTEAYRLASMFTNVPNDTDTTRFEEFYKISSEVGGQYRVSDENIHRLTAVALGHFPALKDKANQAKMDGQGQHCV